MKSLAHFLKSHRYLAISVIYVAVMAGASYWPSPSDQRTSVAQREFSVEKLPSNLPSRDLAIQEALAKGQKSYVFTTGFIPGIGVVAQEGSMNLNQ